MGKRLKTLKIEGKILGIRVYTKYFGFDLPVTKGILEETGLHSKKKDGLNIFVIIKPKKESENKNGKN